MKKWILLAGFLLLVLFGSLWILSSETGENPYTHSHTKAVCDNGNYCQDYEIYCRKTNIINITPITGAAIQFSETWQDPRSVELRNKLC
jgi:hypothetical protein